MNVKELAQKLDLTVLSEAGLENEIKGAYIGDLLSIVMIKCNEGDAWITAQTHVNILQTAMLNDAACIIIVGNAAIDDALIEKANEKEVALLTTNMESYELAWKLHEVI